ncbi:MAG: cysteine desulfurase NifS [Rhodopirellula sp.]|nr:cysteine desulfurase NifS [Rhodopirellula sp.]OUX49512.1 MAG: cysteine desulfurase NifS [Rhodopirellula sp. TMED283]
MIYLDNHATTRCDPRVVDAMVPWLSEHYGNPHSGHSLGVESHQAMGQAVCQIAQLLNAPVDSVVMTSGATESNNLAIRGMCLHPRQKRRHIVTVTTEHPAVLDVFADLQSSGFRVTHVPVQQSGSANAGIVDLQKLEEAIDDDTALVSVMWANNEIGAIAPMTEIAGLCHDRGALLHSDATQAVGRIPVDMIDVDIDLLSATAHKLYGPKGTGLLIIGNSNRRVRLNPQIVGGGQQSGIRSGTMNPAGIIGMATAMQLCNDGMQVHNDRVAQLRDQIWNTLNSQIEGLQLNGPDFDRERRLPGNLNLALPAIEGQAWMSAVPEIAFSSGSACSAAHSAPSHVLTALGIDESRARRSARFGVGRFNQVQDIQTACEMLVDGHSKLLALAH